MKRMNFGALSLLFIFRLSGVISQSLSEGMAEHATTPPRGWNSYDSFCWTISEEEFLQNAELVSLRLRAHGYKYVVVDYLWYRRKVKGAYVDSLGFDVIDEWGRMIPDPGRWPSSKGGKGFAEVANKVHSMGLKFGIHVMRGISTQAFNANTPILDTAKLGAYEESGRRWTARDIGMKERACAWMPHGFMAVNTKLGAGRAFLQSLYEQYADWGVDFVKNDCVFGDDLDIDEISFVSEVLRTLDRPILYSLSPGTSVTPAMADKVSGLVNMYRITGDDWDSWGDVAAHFDVARDFAAANKIGDRGLLGKSWPDLDMLPLGWLTDPGSNLGPHRQCNLNLIEQRTQMTLWAMAKSPLMFGGDMRKLDETTYNLITNPTILEINAFSSNNMEFPLITSTHDSEITNQVLILQSGHQRNVGLSRTHFLALTTCTELNAKHWSIEPVDEDLDQVCWKENSGSNQMPFCLYRRKPRFASDEDIVLKTRHEGQTHLLASTMASICLDASPKQKLTSKEFKRGSLSPCRWDANQMWELNDNGTLMNSYSSQCAAMKTVEDNVASGGIRFWVATGREGEVYIALFNLSGGKMVISTKISDLSKAFPDKNISTSCKCREVWSGDSCGMNKSQSIAPVSRLHRENEIQRNADQESFSFSMSSIAITTVSNCLDINSSAASSPNLLKSHDQDLKPSSVSTSGLVSLRLKRLVSEFQSLPEPIDRVKRLLDYATVLPQLRESTRTPENRVAGCSAQVWLEVVIDEFERMQFRADSDSEITKGFCYCLIYLLDGASPAEVLQVKAEDLADMNVGLPVRSRVNSWNNVLVSMKERTKALIAETEERPAVKQPSPSVVTNANGNAI
ncbi:hypothetical protein Nepgr_003392 [Nepenthes gracilis]|uniref:Alpha-galactosidase n=1 Tax=Nepenthes gracilis TaxID=150966 RepID=A0AAD3RZE9_NEPGR|nr:hypothetical protein Nepgr_003392 [Nepenthes gracilis]